jgi:2-oxoglutarate/2-oxoacid ferredoxin oxidoreductase subunit alpha
MDDINVVISGAAGEGIQTVGELLTRTAAIHGYSVFSWQEYESRIRGGQNSYSIRISEKMVNAPLTKADILLSLNSESLDKYKNLVKENGLIVAETKLGERSIPVPFSAMAKESFGDEIYANIIAVGALASVLGMDIQLIRENIKIAFAKKTGEIISNNEKALIEGFSLAQKECGDMCWWRLPKKKDRHYVISGNEALSIGAARAGCRFISAYPMTPSTGIITCLSSIQERLGIFTEQAEDEISAINMAIGASYAGIRAMTATSGGGFALMVEGISLAGMTETPLVVVLAQRPGPATGLPTRTAQGDLLFAINAGHGEFPKVVLAVSDPVDAFHKMVRAFNLADEFQTVVIVMTDQLFADSHFSIKDFHFEKSAPVLQSPDPGAIENYRRYMFSDTGISPRLAPGASRHLVAADSDEHDEWGHITEDLAETAPAMVQKRLSKLNALKRAILPPEEISLDDAEIVFVGWGSSLGALREASAQLRNEGIRIGIIHFTEMWPLPFYNFPENKTYWNVESNATAQLARLLKGEYEINFKGSILRFDGLPLTAEHIKRQFYEQSKRI